MNELDDQFYILYGDNYWDGNFQKHNNMIDNFYLVTTLYDTLGHEDGNFKLDKNLKVIGILKKVKDTII